MRHRAELRISLPSFRGISVCARSAIFLAAWSSLALSWPGRSRRDARVVRGRNFRRNISVSPQRKAPLYSRNLEFDNIDTRRQQTPQQSAKRLIAQTSVNIFAASPGVCVSRRSFACINSHVVCPTPIPCLLCQLAISNPSAIYGF